MHTIPWHNPDEILPHLPGNVRQNNMVVGQLHPEHGPGQNLHYNPLALYRIFFCHN